MHFILKLFVICTTILYMSPLCFAGGTPPAEAEAIIPVPEEIYGHMVSPITGCAITSDFYRSNGDLHGGLDFGSNDTENGGETIMAAAHGVAFSEYDPGGFANYVYIWHNDITYGWVVTRYGHMEPGSIMIESGQEVNAGQPIGIVGSGCQGSSTGPHLHFDIKDTTSTGGTFYNPHDGWIPGLEESINGQPNYASPAFKFLWDASYDFGEPIKELINDITKACTDGVKMIQDLILYIFWILVSIDIAVGASLLVIDSDKGNGIFKWLLYKLIMFGILLYFMTHWAGGLANVLRDFYIMVGGDAAGASFADVQSAVSDPLKLIQKGAEVVTPILNEIGKYNRIGAVMLNFVNIIFMVVFGAAIFGMLAIITTQIVLAYIEFYVVMLFSFVNFMFSGLKQTRYLASRSLNAIFAVSVKLLFFCLFSLMLQAAMTHFKSDPFFQTQTKPTVTASQQANLGGQFQSVEQVAAAIRQVESSGNYDIYNDDGNGGTSGAFGAYQQMPEFWDGRCQEYEESTGETLCKVTDNPSDDFADAPHYSGCELYSWCPENQDKVSIHMMYYYFNESGGDYRYIATRWLGTSSDEYWAKVCSANAGGKPLTITIMNFEILLKVTLLILTFMIMGDRIGDSIIKQFSGKGFRFSNEDQG